MTTAVCPHCGYDLDRFEEVVKGDLRLTSHEVFWRGCAVRLTVGQHLMVSALARANGIPLSRNAMVEIIDSEGLDALGVVTVLICRVRKAFKAVDPEFHGIQTVPRVGFRWAA